MVSQRTTGIGWHNYFPELTELCLMLADDVLVTVPEKLLLSTFTARSSVDFSPYLQEAASLNTIQVCEFVKIVMQAI